MKNRIYILYTFISVFILGTSAPTVAMFKRVVIRGTQVARQGANRFGSTLGPNTNFTSSNVNNSGNGSFSSTNTNYSPYTSGTQLTVNQNTLSPTQGPSPADTRRASQEIRTEFGGIRSYSTANHNRSNTSRTTTNMIRPADVESNVTNPDHKDEELDILDFGDEETNGTGFEDYKGVPLATSKKLREERIVEKTDIENPYIKKSLRFLPKEKNKIQNPIIDPEWPVQTKREFIKGTGQPSLTNPEITEKTIRLAEKRGQTNRFPRAMDKKTRKIMQNRVNQTTKIPRERSEKRAKINRDLTDIMKAGGDDIDPRVIEAIIFHNKQSIKRFEELVCNLKKGSATKDIKNSLNLLGGNVAVVGSGFADELCGEVPKLKAVFLKNQTGLKVIYDKKGQIKYIVAANEKGFLLFEPDNRHNKQLGDGTTSNSLVAAGGTGQKTIKVFDVKNGSFGEMFRNMQKNKSSLNIFEVVDGVKPKAFAQTLQLDVQPRELTDSNKQLTKQMVKKGPQQHIGNNVTEKLALLNKGVKKTGQQPDGKAKNTIRVYTNNIVANKGDIQTRQTKQPKTVKGPNTGIQHQQLNNIIQPKKRVGHPGVRKKLFSGVRPEKYKSGHEVPINNKKKGYKPKSIMNIKVTKKPVKKIRGQFVKKVAVKQTKLTEVKEKELIRGQAQQVELKKDNVPMVAEKVEKGLTVRPDDQKSLMIRQEKKNSLMVQPKKEVTRDKRQPYNPPVPLLMLSVPQNEQVQVTDSSENNKNEVDGGTSQSAFPHYSDNAGRRHKKGPVNKQNDTMKPKNDHSEDNKQEAVPTTSSSMNADENDAYEPNKSRSERVYQSDVSDNSPEGQKAGGLGGANSDVPGKPSQGRRLPFSWLWLILGSIAEALQYRRRRKFLNIFPGA